MLLWSLHLNLTKVLENSSRHILLFFSSMLMYARQRWTKFHATGSTLEDVGRLWGRQKKVCSPVPFGSSHEPETEGKTGSQFITTSFSSSCLFMGGTLLGFPVMTESTGKLAWSKDSEKMVCYVRKTVMAAEVAPSS